MERYNRQLPSIHNYYFHTNLLQIIDDLPSLKPIAEEPPCQRTNISVSRNDSIYCGDLIQNSLVNVLIANKHECDGLGNDTEINQYQILKAILGKGAHSFVKLAKKQNKIYVSPLLFQAIKTISFDRLKKRYYIKDHHIAKMVNCEIELLIKLRSPNIIGFEEAIYAVEKQRIFIVLEFCSKGSLLRIINGSNTVPKSQWHKIAKKYFIQLLKGLQKMHESNIIHRDMKSQNVLVNEKDEVKIIDFNISAEIPSSGMITITDKFVGTKTYAPPQLVIPNSKPRQMDGRLIDVWALGVTFLQLWERKHPFNANNVEQLIKMVSKPVQLNKNYDPDLKDLIQKMLHLQNSQRIHISDILNHPWILK